MQEMIMKYIEQIKEIWIRLTRIQKIMVISLISFLFVTFVVLMLWSNKTNYNLLYSNLNVDDAQKITEYLQSKEIKFKTEANGSTIYVEEKMRDPLRIEISDHFPKFDLKGWELFDKSNIGLTDFTQKVNYKRAMEGELSRTINVYEQIKYSRVLLSLPEKSLFVEEDKEPTAAVTIMLKNPRMGAGKELVASITLLVARSVEGLRPENVVVSDFQGVLLSEELSDDPLAKISNTQLKLKRQVEERLEKQTQSMLDKMVGKGNAIVRIAASLNFDQISRRVNRFDPENSATRSEELNNEATGETEKVAHSITNYEINHSEESTINAVGGIDRLTISVTLNYKPGDGGVLVQRTVDEITALENVVRNAVGFDAARQDQIFVTSYPFDTSVMEKEMEEMAKAEREAMIMAIAKRLLVVMAILFVILFLRNLIRQFANKYLKTEEEEAAPGLEEQPIIEPELLELKKRKEEFLNQVISLSETTPEDIAQLLRTWLLQDINPGE